MTRRKTLRTRFPNSPREAARHLIRQYGHDRAARYARDKEATWGPNAEWWHSVVECMPEVAAGTLQNNLKKALDTP